VRDSDVSDLASRDGKEAGSATEIRAGSDSQEKGCWKKEMGTANAEEVSTHQWEEVR